MTKTEKLNALLSGVKHDDSILFHPIFMHFAARFNGNKYAEFASDYRVLVESNVKCIEYFEHDAVMLLSDPFRETSAFGADIYYPEDAVPRCREHIIKSLEDIKKLNNPDVYKNERTLDRIKGTEYFKKLLGDSIPVIGWVEGPLAEACDLAGVNEILLNIAIEPDFVKFLMEKCLVTAKDFAKAQTEAGCYVIGVGDAICSQISAEMYREYVLPLHNDLFDFIHSLGAFVKLHICGNITHLLPEIGKLPVDILDIDWLVDLDEAFKNIGKKTAACGNLDPVRDIMKLTPDEIYLKSTELIQKHGNDKFILSGGCEITVDTPYENIISMKKAALKGGKK